MLSFFPRDVLDEILNLIESVSEGFPSYSFMAESKKGHNFAIQGPTEKKMFSLIFCTDATNKISSS